MKCGSHQSFKLDLSEDGVALNDFQTNSFKPCWKSSQTACYLLPLLLQPRPNMPQTPEHTHALLMFYFGVSVNQTDVVRSNSSASGQCQNLVNVPHRCKEFLNGVTEHFGGGKWEKLLPYSPFCFIKVLHKTLCSKISRQLHCTHFYIYRYIYI